MNTEIIFSKLHLMFSVWGLIGLIEWKGQIKDLNNCVIILRELFVVYDHDSAFM